MTDHEKAHPDPVFFIWARQTIKLMREWGISETRIACVVTELRSVAIHEEQFRRERLLSNNPPSHIGWPAMQEAINARF